MADDDRGPLDDRVSVRAADLAHSKEIPALHPRKNQPAILRIDSGRELSQVQTLLGYSKFYTGFRKRKPDV